MIVFILLLNLCTVESKEGKAKRLHSSLGYSGRNKLQVRLSTLNKDVRWKSLCNKMCHARGLILSTCTEVEFAFDSGQTVKEVETGGLNTRRTRLSVIRMLLSINSFFSFYCVYERSVDWDPKYRQEPFSALGIGIFFYLPSRNRVNDGTLSKPDLCLKHAQI